MTNVINRFRALLPLKKVERFTLRSTKGFTLIELLVVIAIIAVLAAVVLVALGNARVRARDARRVSDLNNIALSMEVYLDTTNSATYPGSAPVGSFDHPSFNSIITTLALGNVIKGTYEDPLNANPVSRTYRGQTNIANARGSGAAVNTSYLLGGDLETASTASCASDYDGESIGAVLAPDAAPNQYCGENVVSNCDGVDTSAVPVDYCICSGRACQ